MDNGDRLLRHFIRDTVLARFAEDRPGESQAFITLTCKLALPNGRGGMEPCSRAHLSRATSVLMRRVAEPYFGNAVRRFGRRLPALPCFEKHKDGERDHLHLAIAAPRGTAEELVGHVFDAADRIEWFYRERDAQPVYGDLKKLFAYITKSPDSIDVENVRVT